MTSSTSLDLKTPTCACSHDAQTPIPVQPFQETSCAGAVYILIDGLTIAGAEKQALILARELSRHHDITVAYLKTPDQAQRERASVLTGSEVNRVQYQFAGLPFLCSLLVRREITLITFAAKSNIVGRFLRMLNSGIRLITSIRNEHFAKWTVSNLYRITANTPEFTTYNSNRALRNGVRKGFSKAAQSRRIHNYLDMVPRTRTGNRRIAHIAYFGRLVSQKRVDWLLIAFQKLVKSGKALRLSVFGYGPLEGELERLASELEIREQICFKGAYKSISEHLEDIDLVILPSAWEGMPNVVLECGMLGVPIIGSDAGGMGDIEDAIAMRQFLPLTAPDDLFQLLSQWIEKPIEEMNVATDGLRRHLLGAHDEADITQDWLKAIHHAQDHSAR